ncbi:MAG: DUF3592 domain-containing protein [Pseudomonadota bacterium]
MDRTLMIFIVGLVGIFLLIGFAMLGYAGVSWTRGYAAKSWPTTQGEIIASTLHIDRDSDGDTYTAKVRYQYEVDGRRYESDRISFGFSGTDNRQDHQAIKDRLSAGTHVSVCYNMANPQMATLSTRQSKGLIFLTIFGIMWTTFSVGFVALLALGSRSNEPFIQSILVYG